MNRLTVTVMKTYTELAVNNEKDGEYAEAYYKYVNMLMLYKSKRYGTSNEDIEAKKKNIKFILERQKKLEAILPDRAIYKCNFLTRYEKRKMTQKMERCDKKITCISLINDNKENIAKLNIMQNIGGAIVKEKSKICLSDVAGLEVAKAALNEAVILPYILTHWFTKKRRPWRGILLYGAPGTGKTFLAKAAEAEAYNSTFISVSSSDLVSKYMGESEQRIKALFEKARQCNPSLIFIDEVDSLMSSRSEKESDCVRRIKTEFLVQMDGVGNENDGILVLGATNNPWVLDAAFRRLFEKRIYIPLPEEPARIHMFKHNMEDMPNDLNDSDFNSLGSLTNGFSGADISLVVNNALMEPVRKVMKATHFKKVSNHSIEDSNVIQNDWYIPCSPEEYGAIETSWEALPGDRIKESIITMQDFLTSLDNSKPSVNKDDLDKFKKFREDFGQKG